MSADRWVEISGNLVGLVAIATLLLTLIRDWRGGSPEMRMIRAQLTTSNEQFVQMIDTLSTQNRKLLETLRRSTDNGDIHG